MRKPFLLIVLAYFFLVVSCKKDDFVPNSPEVETYEVSDINAYSVKLSGKIINQGDSAIVEAGFIIGKSPKPAINLYYRKIPLLVDESGDLSTEVTELPVDITTFYVRAYAISSVGVGYGKEVQFTSLGNKIFHGNVSLGTQDDVVEFGTNKYNTIDGNLYIYGNVTDLSPLKDIYIVNEEFSIESTTDLESLNGLENLRRAGSYKSPYYGGIVIYNNSGLKSLQGLNGLEICNFGFNITNNNALSDLQGLESLTKIISGSLTIQGCENLTSLDGLNNLSKIDHWLNISINPSLTDISSLSNLTNDIIGVYFYNNLILENLRGLEGITFLETLRVESNNALISLDGLNNLDSVSNEINIYSNNSLNDLSVLKKIKSVPSLRILKNQSLTSLNGLNNFLSVGVFSVSFNSNLSTLNGLENLSSVGSLIIRSNNSLASISGLNGLKLINDERYSITIEDNSNLPSLDGLENLQMVKGDVEIISNSILADFCALKPLFTEGTYTGSINISENLSNPAIESILSDCE